MLYQSNIFEDDLVRPFHAKTKCIHQCVNVILHKLTIPIPELIKFSKDKNDKEYHF